MFAGHCGGQRKAAVHIFEGHDATAHAAPWAAAVDFDGIDADAFPGALGASPLGRRCPCPFMRVLAGGRFLAAARRTS